MHILGPSKEANLPEQYLDFGIPIAILSDSNPPERCYLKPELMLTHHNIVFRQPYWCQYCIDKLNESS